ncbi:MAG TPA: zf-TFIIB domain-containing protein [Pirellulales bacterium]
MKRCPVCNSDLFTAQRQGVEIDHCPRCRGVWLDRGELDKLLSSSSAFREHDSDEDSDWDGYDRRAESRSPAPPRDYPPPRDSPPPRDYPPPSDYRPKKRESWLSQLFDFD